MRIRSGQYTIRYAAGVYWIVDIVQIGPDYKPPFSVNGCGALIFKCMLAGSSEIEVIESMQQEYGIEAAQAKEDISQFLEQLAIKGIVIEKDEDN